MEELTKLNASLRNCYVEHHDENSHHRPAKHPFVLKANGGHYLSSYASFEAAERAAKNFEAHCP